MHALALVGFTAVATLVPGFRLWPLVWLIPHAGYAALVAIVPPLRATFRPWRFGRVSTPTVAATLVIAITSCAVLVAFHYLTRPDISSYGRFLPVTALGSVVVVGILFSIFNALFEEVIFHGVLFDAVESQWGVSIAVVLLPSCLATATCGYPPGPLGAVLAGTYALCLGWLQVFSGGIGLPILAHIPADATIFTIIARSGVL
jgi:membrane protease YdiL (CAAX protease family)